MKTLVTLGRLALTDAGSPILGERRKDVALLAFLASQSRPVSRVRLASLLWPNVDESRARQSLRRAISDLRGALGDAVVLGADDVALTPGALSVDADQFERSIAAGDLRAAVALWQGDYLAGLEDIGDDDWRTWLEATRMRLRTQLGWALERLTVEAESEGNWQNALVLAEQWTAALPADERAATSLMKFLRAAGRVSDAAARHAVLVAQIQDLTGAAPSAAFLRLGQAPKRESPRAPAVRGFLTPDFVGRDQTMRSLSAEWGDVRNGAGRVVFVDAEHGLGKSRLGEEFVRLVRLTEGRKAILEARAFAGDRDHPLSAVRQLLAQLADNRALAAASPEVVAALAELSPAIRERFPHASAAPRMSAPVAMIRALTDVTVDAPLLLMLHDAATADVESQRVLAEIIRRPPARVLIVLTGDSGDWATSRLRDDALGLSHLTRLTLEPLSVEETRRLVASMAPMEADVALQLAQRLHAEAGGRPGLVQSLLVQLAHDGVLSLDGLGRWKPSVPIEQMAIELPTDVRELTTRRLSRLAHAERTVYEAAAVIGPRMDMGLLETVAALPATEFRDSVAHLLARRFLRAQPGARELYELPGDAERRAVYDLIAPSARRQFHRAAAAALRDSDNAEQRADAARHARLAGSVRRRYAVPLLTAAVVIAIVATVGMRIATARPGKPLPIAVGGITSSLPADSARGFATLLAIDLSRVNELDVISDRRLNEVAAGRRGAKADEIASAAGAREILEGVLTRNADNSLRADLRRTDIVTGKTRAAYTLEASDISQLADRVSEQIARDLGVAAPVARPNGMTRSIAAYRLYEQGLRAFYENNDGAIPLLTAALAEDSTFAMAAFYKGLMLSSDSGDAYLAQALRHAQRTNDRERLLISATWGRRMADPRVLAWAESLVTRFPSEPDAHVMYADEMTNQWNLTEGLAHYRRALEMDSANASTAVRCRACDAARGMIGVYSRMDSLAAAERIARTWLRWQPRSPTAWESYSTLLGESGRYPEAHAAVDSVVKYSTDPAAPFLHTAWWFYSNDFPPIDRMWRELEHSSKPALREEALWTRVIASRTQGRMRDALEAAREYRRYRTGAHRGDLPGAMLLEAIVLTENGHPREAAALFDSVARLTRVAPFPSRLGANRAWDWTHAATAYAAAGDTVPLHWLEDSVRVNGSHAAERYQLLHHYVHGLLLAAEHRPLDAAAAFRQAIPGRADAPEHSGDNVYVRARLELGRALLDGGRPSDAIWPLVQALNGPTSAAGLYATRTDLQALLGLAYERSQKPDSAIVQYRRAIQAWRSADPEFTARRAQLEERVAALVKARTVR